MGASLAVLDGDGISRDAVLAVGTARGLHGIGDQHQPLTRQTVSQCHHVGGDMEAVADHLAEGGLRGQAGGHHAAVTVVEGRHGVEGMGQGGDPLTEQRVGGMVVGIGVPQGQGGAKSQGAAAEFPVGVQLQGGGDVTGAVHATDQSLQLIGIGGHQKVCGVSATACHVQVATLQMGTRDMGESPLGGGGLSAEGVDVVNGAFQLGQRRGGQGGHDGGHATVQIGLRHPPHEGQIGGAEVPARAAVGMHVHQAGDHGPSLGVVYGHVGGRGGIPLGIQGGDTAVLHKNRTHVEGAGGGMVDPRAADEAGVHRNLLSVKVEFGILLSLL